MYYGYAYAYPKFNPVTDTIVAFGIGVMIVGSTNIVG